MVVTDSHKDTNEDLFPKWIEDLDEDYLDNHISKESCRVHDWRNYVPDAVNINWDSLTRNEQRIAILITDSFSDRE